MFVVVVVFVIDLKKRFVWPDCLFGFVVGFCLFAFCFVYFCLSLLASLLYVCVCCEF